MTTDARAVHETERVRAIFDKSAASYDGWMRPFDRLLLDGGRSRVYGRARGRTLEIAVGTGLNLPFYPPDVEVTGVDVSPGMLAVARWQADALGRAVELRIADAHALDFPDESFDTVVVTLPLCSIPDERRALAEAHRAPARRPNRMSFLSGLVAFPVGWHGSVVRFRQVPAQ
jgi:ubiquinone/menaquinone biosynthesis C-methylase UbiE